MQLALSDGWYTPPRQALASKLQSRQARTVHRFMNAAPTGPKAAHTPHPLPTMVSQVQQTRPQGKARSQQQQQQCNCNATCAWASDTAAEEVELVSPYTRGAVKPGVDAACAEAKAASRELPAASAASVNGAVESASAAQICQQLRARFSEDMCIDFVPVESTASPASLSLRVLPLVSGVDGCLGQKEQALTELVHARAREIEAAHRQRYDEQAQAAVHDYKQGLAELQAKLVHSLSRLARQTQEEMTHDINYFLNVGLPTIESALDGRR